MNIDWEELKERLLATRIIEENGCWSSTLSPTSTGYKQIVVAYNNKLLIHRVSLKIFKGVPIEDKYETRHLCNNKACWNPEHLIPGNHKDNMQDSIRAGTFRGYNHG
jgi:hypothetical protein